MQGAEACDEVKGLPLNLKVRVNKKHRTFFDSRFFHFPFNWLKTPSNTGTRQLLQACQITYFDLSTLMGREFCVPFCYSFCTIQEQLVFNQSLWQKPWLQYSLRSVSCQLYGTVTLRRAEACNEDEALRRVSCQFYNTVALQETEAATKWRVCASKSESSR